MGTPARISGMGTPARIRGMATPARIRGMATPARIRGMGTPARIRGMATPARLNPTTFLSFFPIDFRALTLFAPDPLPLGGLTKRWWLGRGGGICLV